MQCLKGPGSHLFLVLTYLVSAVPTPAVNNEQSLITCLFNKLLFNFNVSFLTENVAACNYIYIYISIFKISARSVSIGKATL